MQGRKEETFLATWGFVLENIQYKRLSCIRRNFNINLHELYGITNAKLLVATQCR